MFDDWSLPWSDSNDATAGAVAVDDVAQAELDQAVLEASQYQAEYAYQDPNQAQLGQDIVDAASYQASIDPTSQDSITQQIFGQAIVNQSGTAGEQQTPDSPWYSGGGGTAGDIARVFGAGLDSAVTVKEKLDKIAGAPYDRSQGLSPYKQIFDKYGRPVSVSVNPGGKGTASGTASAKPAGTLGNLLGKDSEAAVGQVVKLGGVVLVGYFAVRLALSAMRG